MTAVVAIVESRRRLSRLPCGSNLPQEGQTVIDDLVKGRIEFDNTVLDDLIILRSNGYATYNFSVVIDDALMNMTHVIRGDDHVNNTPRQVALFQALGYEIPKFAHLPMILGADKSRLSKRHGATSVLAYQEMGYLPESVGQLFGTVGMVAWRSGNLFFRGNDQVVRLETCAIIRGRIQP